MLDRNERLWYTQAVKKVEATVSHLTANVGWVQYHEKRTACFVGLVRVASATRFFLEVSYISSKELMINEEIRDKEVRLISAEGEQLGVVSIKEAQAMALEKGLDLVKIAPQATPPVCKIMDYGKYRFEQMKREKEARKNQKTMNLKEVRLSPSIDDHDFETKANHAVKFLKAGDKVKVSVRFRGREVHHAAMAEGLMERFAEYVSEVGTVEKKPKLEGRNMFMFIAPKTNS